jgi:hypothetical protein
MKRKITDKVRTLQKIGVLEISRAVLQEHFNAVSHGEKVRLGRILKKLGIESRGKSYLFPSIYESILKQDTVELEVESKDDWDCN